ncbi:MAG: cysteine hydrolase [Bdellovibrionaceae bacterium]|nr:cysteine hydrolase [Pseudobdellovibrionaceae bacterium]MBX3034560.1 cysteine hydrolase [Pseudobdellovibrionaceae bacterium]
MRKQEREGRFALVILDMLNLFDFPEGKELSRASLPVAKSILRLKKRLKAKKVPVIYVNDNFGKWQSNWKNVFEVCSAEGRPGRDIARILKPDDDDYFVLKPKHSGFYSTTFDLLLKHLKVQKLILTGIAGNICVLFTAHDAHMRDYQVIVPRDCTASNKRSENEFALRQMREALGLRTPVSSSLRV